jgi:hypothetical protein
VKTPIIWLAKTFPDKRLVDTLSRGKSSASTPLVGGVEESNLSVGKILSFHQEIHFPEKHFLRDFPVEKVTILSCLTQSTRKGEVPFPQRGHSGGEAVKEAVRLYM